MSKNKINPTLPKQGAEKHMTFGNNHKLSNKNYGCSSKLEPTTTNFQFRNKSHITKSIHQCTKNQSSRKKK
jgi:hypothetical protein